MTTWIALYRGGDVASAKLIAVSADPDLVTPFALQLLERRPMPGTDPVLAALTRGERDALAEIAGEHGMAAPR